MRRFLVVAACLFVANVAFAAKEIQIELEVPVIDEDPYFRPYVAVWLEDELRSGKETLALWYQVDLDKPEKTKGKKWLKDLRQWWRKLGRKSDGQLDSVTGPTRKPGVYSIRFDYTHMPLGKHQLNFEASREDGGRSYQRVAIELGVNQSFVLPAEGELGAINIQVEK
jgi:hypothetical protein